jgi:hypothetical protein
MPKDIRPLDPGEEMTLRRLLARSGESLHEAQQRHAKEIEQERRLEAKRDRMAREEARLSKRLAELRVDIDCVSAEIHKTAAPSGVAWRFVNERLQEYGELATKQSFFNTPHDTLDRDALMLLAQIGLSLFEHAAKPKSGKPPLRERMEAAGIPSIGMDVPGGGAPSDGRAALAQAIINSGRKRRGEIE